MLFLLVQLIFSPLQCIFCRLGTVGLYVHVSGGMTMEMRERHLEGEGLYWQKEHTAEVHLTILIKI